VLDVRRLSEYTGEEVRARHGGHVPGARHWFWQRSLDWDGLRMFRPPEEVRAGLAELGVTTSTPGDHLLSWRCACCARCAGAGAGWVPTRSGLCRKLGGVGEPRRSAAGARASAWRRTGIMMV
jgi:hypothetical protein